MTTDTPFDESYLGGKPYDSAAIPRVPFGADKVIARRAAQEVRPESSVIFGFGASSDAPLVMAEAGAIRRRSHYGLRVYD